MCVAIYSPMGTNIPSEVYLKNCWNRNRDGAGIAYSDSGKVKILKGFMTWDSFKEELDRLNKTLDLTNRGVLIHFRIATHGGVNPECCHPFPLVSDYSSMKKTEYDAEYAVIHNGIISLTSAEAHRLSDVSDTMVFINEYIANIATNTDWFNNPANWNLIEKLADSKIAILDGSGEIHCTYGFHQADDGNFYSNTSYQTPAYSAAKTTSAPATATFGPTKIEIPLLEDIDVDAEEKLAKRIFAKEYCDIDVNYIYLKEGVIVRDTGEFVSTYGNACGKDLKKKIKNFLKQVKKLRGKDENLIALMQIDSDKFSVATKDGDIFSSEETFVNSDGEIYFSTGDGQYCNLKDEFSPYLIDNTHLMPVSLKFEPTMFVEKTKII